VLGRGQRGQQEHRQRHVKIDTVNPTIALSAPNDGASFLLGSTHAASYGCSDGGSDIASCTGTVDTGANVDTGSVGGRTPSR
jgi:hypothetical protein